MRGLRFIEFQCRDCKEEGLISKQITDGYSPYCFRCGSQNLEEKQEIEMIRTSAMENVKEKFKGDAT